MRRASACWLVTAFAAAAAAQEPLREYIQCMNLQEVRDKLGYEQHGRTVDYGIFVHASPPFYRKDYKLSRENHMKLVGRLVLAGIKTPPWRREYTPADLDLRLKPGSAAVDAGVHLPNINDGFVGRAPDLGAYEHGQGVPAYGPRPAE